MIHDFEVVGTEGTCKKCGADFQEEHVTPCHPKKDNTEVREGL